MKAQELRIGNYLIKIDGTLIEVSSLEIECAEGMNGHFNLTFEPIPLTKEWLLKFGFEAKKYKRFLLIKKDFEIEVGLNQGSLYHSFLNGTAIDIHFVHQLQKLYFTLTRTKLFFNEKTNRYESIC